MYTDEQNRQAKSIMTLLEGQVEGELLELETNGIAHVEMANGDDVTLIKSLLASGNMVETIHAFVDQRVTREHILEICAEYFKESQGADPSEVYRCALLKHAMGIHLTYVTFRNGGEVNGGSLLRDV